MPLMMELASLGRAPEHRPKDYLHIASKLILILPVHVLALNMNFKYNEKIHHSKRKPLSASSVNHEQLTPFIISCLFIIYKGDSCHVELLQKNSDQGNSLDHRIFEVKSINFQNNFFTIYHHPPG